MKKKSLLRKILIFIGIPVTAILVGTTVFITQTIKQSVSNLTTNELTAKTQAAAYQANNFLTKYSDIVEQMAANDLLQQYFEKSPEIKNSNTKEGFGGVKATTENIYQTDPDTLSAVWVADCATNKAVLNNSDQLYSMTLSERPWYQAATTQKSVVFVEPYQDTVTGKIVMSVVCPIYKSDNLVGFAGVDITLDRLYSTIKSYKLGKSGFYILTSAGGQLVYYPDESLKNKSITESNLSQNAVKAIQGKKEGLLTYNAMGKTNYGYLSPVGNTGWTITTGLPESEFYNSYYTVLQTVILISVIALIILLLLIVVISKSITNPLVKLKEVANKIAQGNLDVSVEIKSTDEVGQVFIAISKTVDRLKQYIQYIDEISSVLNQIANGDLTFQLQCDYTGEFAKIKESLNHIKTNLTHTFSSINVAASQVASSSVQISNSAQSLAQGAAEQASSIEELDAQISEISEHINQNAEHTRKASENMNRVTEEMEVSNQLMNEMMEAMTVINESSSKIGSIVKTIEDIAFQTNILALNAAVEAARAGSAGKGFAVVADEVRNLAGKSAEAAKNTTALIGDSISQVENGSKIADKTAQSLSRVVEHVEKVSETVKHISEASIRQSEGITQAKIGVDQISSVIQTNSATSEESAAASEELSGQAETLKELVEQFKLAD